MKIFLATAVVAGFAVGAWGATVNITISDPLTPSITFNGGSDSRVGPGTEDNEIEIGQTHQSWDVEAMAWNSGTLYLIGGFDFKNGHGTSGAPGDLFIRSGGPAGWQPTSTLVPDPIANSTLNPGYDFAVELSNLSSWVGDSGMVSVAKLSAQTLLDTVIHDNTRANPWKVDDWSNADVIASADAIYNAGLSANDVALLTGFSNFDYLRGDGINDLHNVLTIDLAGTGIGNSGLWFSYTMACGNDVVKGHAVPDGGLTLMLLGASVTGLALLGRKARR